MKKTHQQPVSKRAFFCPQCGKQRLLRPLDHKVSFAKQKYTDKNKQGIELHEDICEYCKIKNSRIHFEPTKADIKKVLKALKDEGKTEESLEDLL